MSWTEADGRAGLPPRPLTARLLEAAVRRWLAGALAAGLTVGNLAGGSSALAGAAPPAGAPAPPGAVFLQLSGLQLAAVGLRHEVVAYTLQGVRRIAVGKPGDEVTEVAAAPLAGRVFAVVRSSCQGDQRRVAVVAADLASDGVRVVRSVRVSCGDEQGLHLLSLTPSPDGSRVAWAVTGVDWSGWRVARADGVEEAVPALPPADEAACKAPGGFAGGWPLAWSLDGRSLYVLDFESNFRSVSCVRRLDFQSRSAELVFVGVMEAQAEELQGLRPLRSTPEELARRIGPAAQGLYGLSMGAPDSLLKPLGGGLRRPKVLLSADGRVSIQRDWGDLVAIESGQERARLVGVVAAPPDCSVEGVCIDADDLWTVAWARAR